jgi:hypothetical protein
LLGCECVGCRRRRCHQLGELWQKLEVFHGSVFLCVSQGVFLGSFIAAVGRVATVRGDPCRTFQVVLGSCSGLSGTGGTSSGSCHLGVDPLVASAVVVVATAGVVAGAVEWTWRAEHSGFLLSLTYYNQV